MQVGQKTYSPFAQKTFAGKCPVPPYTEADLEDETSMEDEEDDEKEQLMDQNTYLKKQLEWKNFEQRNEQMQRDAKKMHHVPRALAQTLLQLQRKNMMNLVDLEMDQTTGSTVENRRLLADILNKWLHDAFRFHWELRDIRNERRCIRRKLKRKR